MSNEQKFKPLLMDGVKEQVFTMNLFKDDNYTFGRVLVMPNSAIPSHLHDTDCEWYLNAETGELVDFCPKGESHSFVNDTASAMSLISIKIVKGIIINGQEFKPLLMDGVKGQVFTMNLFKDDSFSFGRILVMPNSAIPNHRHDTDCEWYLNEETGELVDFCPKGESHSFVNDTALPMVLISIKMVM